MPFRSIPWHPWAVGEGDRKALILLSAQLISGTLARRREMLAIDAAPVPATARAEFRTRSAGFPSGRHETAA